MFLFDSIVGEIKIARLKSETGMLIPFSAAKNLGNDQITRRIQSDPSIRPITPLIRDSAKR
jgi:hypothetical protein